MVKRVKSRLISARVDDDFVARVNQYIEQSDIDQSDLIRASVDEYMTNHPTILNELQNKLGIRQEG